MLDDCPFIDESDAIYKSLEKLQSSKTCNVPWTDPEIYSFQYLCVWVQTFHLRISDEEQRETLKGFFSNAMKVILIVLEVELGKKRSQTELLELFNHNEHEYEKQQQAISKWWHDTELTFPENDDFSQHTHTEIFKMFHGYITNMAAHLNHQSAFTKLAQRLRSKGPAQASTHLPSPSPSPKEAQERSPPPSPKAAQERSADTETFLDNLIQLLRNAHLEKSKSNFADSVQILADWSLEPGQEIWPVLKERNVLEAQLVRRA
jgi:hypothetical protein